MFTRCDDFLCRAMKQDKHRGRIIAFAKRVLQTAFHGSASLAAGMVYLLSAVFKARPHLLKGMSCRFCLADSLLQATLMRDVFCGVSDCCHDLSWAEKSSDAEASVDDNGSESVSKNTTVDEEGYDILARNPKYATKAGPKAKGVAPGIWEFSAMVRHFHPSVRKFAEMVVAHEEIQYSGDPFEDFTTMAFLDRFSYKKPKQRELDVNFQRGISAMQPRNKGGASVYAEDAVNSEAFVGKTARNVRPEEQFFLRYFREKLAREGARRAELDEERKAKGRLCSFYAIQSPRFVT